MTRLTAAAAAILSLALGACDDSPPPAPDRLAQHCRAALGWMVKGQGDITIFKTISWQVEQTYNISLIYGLDGEGVEDRPRRFLQCRYDATEAPQARPAARAIDMGGRDLSAKQVQAINVHISLIGTAD